MTTADLPRVPPYPALMRHFRDAKHGSAPAGVDPRLAPWFWAFYDDAPDHHLWNTDRGAKRYAARELAACLPSALTGEPQHDEDGRLILPMTRATALCLEIEAGRAEGDAQGYMRRSV